MNEALAMDRALELAMRGWGRVAPNPLVGAVVLRDGRVLGEGYHSEFGAPHAEVMALEAARDASGATVVVTLEPCNHHGKTPPCTAALLQVGVRRVVCALRDPTSHAGGGAERLRNAGVEVEVGLRASAAAAQNAAFLWSRRRPDRPFVALKQATSLDGFIADAAGHSHWISGQEGRDYVQWLRAGFDGIAVGRRTAQLDDPQLTVRGPVTPRVAPKRVIFARDGAVPPGLQLIRTASQVATIVVSSRAREPAVRGELGDLGVTVLGADGLAQALCHLREAGLASLLVEGGGALATALLNAGLVDRVYWIQVPIWLRQGVAAFGQGSAAALESVVRWPVTERRALGPDTLLVVDRELCLPAS